MKNVPAGVATTLTIPFVNASGVAVTPTGIVVTVLDQDGKLIHGPEMPVSALEQDALTYTVPGTANALPAGDTLGVRTVEVDLSTTDGPIVLRESYMLRASIALRYLVNAFGTYERLLMAAAEMPRLDAFNAAPDEDRHQALSEAYRRLTRFGYRIEPDGACEEDQDRIAWPGDHILPREWPVMDAERFEELPETFRAALRRAQVQEANAILTTGTAEENRISGLLSKSTGESSAMFRSGKPLDLGISRETLAHLTGFIEIRARLARS